MRVEITEVINNYIILEDNSQYFYTIKAVEILNSLGAVSATLEEYSITNVNGEIYKLYRTKEGNWDDISDNVSSGNKAILMALKSAFDNN